MLFDANVQISIINSCFFVINVKSKQTVLTADRRLFSFFWRVDSLELISSRVATPC